MNDSILWVDTPAAGALPGSGDTQKSESHLPACQYHGCPPVGKNPWCFSPWDLKARPEDILGAVGVALLENDVFKAEELFFRTFFDPVLPEISQAEIPIVEQGMAAFEVI